MPDILIRDAMLPEIQDNHGIKAEVRRVDGVLELGIMTGGYSCCEQWTFYPIHELPPHGDLVDIRAILDIAMQYVPDDDGSCSKANADLRELLDEIENAPVIVPASRQAESFDGNNQTL